MTERQYVYSSNILCPNCKDGIPYFMLWGLSTDSLKWGSGQVKCPGCYQHLHAEDGFLNALRYVPKENYIGFPYAIGATQYLEGQEVTIGTTTVQDVIPNQLIEKSLFERVVPLHNTKKSIRETIDENYESYRSPAVFNGVSIALGILPSDGKLHIITSIDRDDDSLSAALGDSFRVGYEVAVQVADVENPPWIDYLAEASDSIISGNRFGAVPLLVSAFENHLYRQIGKTLRAQGKSQTEIDNWFDAYRGRMGIRWKEAARDGVEDLTGTDIGEQGNKYERTWQKYCNLKNIRDSDIVHLSYLDESKDVLPSDVKEHFDNTVEIMLVIYELCHDTRESIDGDN